MCLTLQHCIVLLTIHFALLVAKGGTDATSNCPQSAGPRSAGKKERRPFDVFDDDGVLRTPNAYFPRLIGSKGGISYLQKTHKLKGALYPTPLPTALHVRYTPSYDPNAKDLDETVVNLAPRSDFVETLSTGYGFNVDGEKMEFGTRREVGRSHWAKSLRCAGPTQDTCEECFHYQDNCWKTTAGGKWRLKMTTDGFLKWPRIVKMIHIQCSEDATKLPIKVAFTEIAYGTMRAFMDGNEIFLNTTMPHKVSLPYNADDTSIDDFRDRFGLKKDKVIYKGASATLMVPIHRRGGHLFALEFWPSGRSPIGSRSQVVVQSAFFYMRNEFVHCADGQVCLAVLTDKHIEDGERLRNSNLAQLECLEQEWETLPDRPEFALCFRWRACLRDAGHEDSIRLLLVAAGVRHNRTVVISNPQSSTQCIDPATEDPESWDCDCFEEMQSRCKAIGLGDRLHRCLKAEYCEHPRVCEAWKRERNPSSMIERCQKKEILEIRAMLRGQTIDNSPVALVESLTHRKNASLLLQKSVGSADDFDGTLRAKKCM